MSLVFSTGMRTGCAIAPDTAAAGAADSAGAAAGAGAGGAATRATGALVGAGAGAVAHAEIKASTTLAASADPLDALVVGRAGKTAESKVINEGTEAGRRQRVQQTA
jgi:hypothetical protein